MAARRRKRRRAAVRRRRPSTARRRRSTRRRTGARRFVMVGGRVYRNPGVVQTLTRGVMDAAVAVAGKTAARFIGSKLPAIAPGTMGQALNSGIAAVVIGLVGSKVGLGGDRVRIAVQGALQAPIEAALAPVFSSLGLSSYSPPMGIRGYSRPMLAGYSAPASPARSMARGMSGSDENGYDMFAGMSQ